MATNFKVIPTYSRYAISLAGVVINLHTGELLSGAYNPAGYHSYRLRGDDGYTKTMGTHRLMAMTYIGLVDGYEDLFVNHINGNKSDNNILNLEWVTPLGNIHHAGFTGLSSKCIPIQVRNVRTGIITEYPSLIDCARHFGVSKDTINWRFKAGESVVDELWNQYRVYAGRREFAQPCVWNTGILLRNAFTGEIKIYQSYAEICTEFNVSPAYLTKVSNAASQRVFRLEDTLYQLGVNTLDFQWRIPDNPYLEFESYTRVKFVVMYNPTYESARIFFGLTEAGEAYNLGKHVVHYRVKANTQKVWDDGLVCHYLFNQ